MTAWVLGVVVKATLLLVAVGVVAQLARRTPAATRHFVWTSGLAVLLLLPALALLLPGWAPQWAGDWAPDFLVQRRAVVEESPISLWLVPSQRQRGDAAPDTEDNVAAGIGAAGAMREAAEGNGGSSGVESVVAASSAGSTTKDKRVASAVAPWLLAAWVVGALLMAAWLAIGLVRRARLARGAQALDEGALVDAGNEAARALDLRRRVRLLLGEAPFVPMTWGVARPVLYLPSAATGWSPQRLRTVLLHELAHVKRNDSLSRFLAQLACSLFWFHPLAWMAARRMLREQERACDDVVIVAGADPHEYAETLVQMAREFRSPRPCVVGALAFSRRSNLEHRLLSILDPLERRRNMSMIRKALVAAVFVVAIVPLAAFRPYAAAQRPGQAEPPVEIRIPRIVVEPVELPIPSVVVDPVEIVIPSVMVEPTELSIPSVMVEPTELAVPSVMVEPTELEIPSVTVDPVELAIPSIVVEPAEIALPQPGGVPLPEVRGEALQEGKEIRIDANGVIRFPADIDALELEPDGNLTVTEGDRRLEVRPADDGSLSFRYTVAGVEQPFDDDARAWINDILASNRALRNLSGDLWARLGGDGLLRLHPLNLQMSLARPQLAMTLKGLEASMGNLALATQLKGLDMSLELGHLDQRMKALELTMPSLATTLRPVSLSLSHLGTDLQSLALTLDAMPDLEPGFGMGRFDSLQIFRDDDSRIVVLRVGEVAIDAASDDITLDDDGELVIVERGPDGRHRLHVYADADGNPVYEWYVDGEETPFDDAARAWLRPILERIR